MNAPVQTLLDVLTQRRDQSQLRLAQAQQQADQAQRQLLDLQSYAAQLDAHWRLKAQTAFAVQEAVGQQHFSEGLHQAIALQTQEVSRQQQQVAHCRSDLSLHEQRLNVLLKVVQSRHAELGLRHQRQEQKVADELAMLAQRRAQPRYSESRL